MRQLVAVGLSLSVLAVISYHAKASKSAGSASELTNVTLARAPSLGPLTARAPMARRARVGTTSEPPVAAAAPVPRAAEPARVLQLDRAVLRDGRYELDLGRHRRALLTLEPSVQAAAEKLLRQTRAPRSAAIVMAMDGKILALAGRRTESPTGGKDGTADASLATEIWAPSASIFKLVTATALVRAGVSPSKRVCFHGGVRSVMESNLADSPRDNRCEDLSFAVAHSQNAIIAKLAHQHLSAMDLTLTARDLGVAGELSDDNGLARATGTLELPADKGVELAKAAAGFRGARLSVLGGAMLATTLANRGIETTPTVVAAVLDGTAVRAAGPPRKRRVIEAKVASAVADMMVGTCREGSAAKAFRSKENSLPREIQVAGKTGTISGAEPFPMEYSWFVGFAPADAPKVAVAVLVGNTDNWWLKGHTVARELLEAALAPARR